MPPPGDDRDVTPRRDLDDRTADALLSGHQVDGEPELSDLLGQLRSLADGPAPLPSTALAALLENGLDAVVVGEGAVPVRPTTSWRRRTFAFPMQVSLAGAGCLVLLLGAAAANRLPATAQTAVADVVESITPLHVPRPVSHPVPAVVPTPTPTRSPGAGALVNGGGDGSDAGQSPSPRPTQDDQGRGGDGHRSDPSPTPGAHKSGGDKGGSGHDRPEASPTPEARQPADVSGNGEGSGDRRRSGHDSGKVSPSPAAPSASSAPDGSGSKSHD